MQHTQRPSFPQRPSFQKQASWSEVVRTQDFDYISRPTNLPTPEPTSPKMRVQPEFETMRPYSKSPSPSYARDSQDLPEVKLDCDESPVHTFSPQTFQRQQRSLIDPFLLELTFNTNQLPRHCAQEVEYLLKFVLHEPYVRCESEMFYDHCAQFTYKVYPIRYSSEAFQGRNLTQDLSQEAFLQGRQGLSQKLARTHVEILSPDLRLSGMIHSNFAPSPSNSPAYLPLRSSSNASPSQKLVQPAVSHLVTKSKKKREKALPKDYRARQDLVQRKHDKALAMLGKWLLDESQGKIFLRGDNVAFIQVKCPKALHAVDSFLEAILADDSIEIVQCTAPLSRKRAGQLKGYLLYIECRTSAMVERIDAIFKKDFEFSGLKCKAAEFGNKLVLCADGSNGSSEDVDA